MEIKLDYSLKTPMERVGLVQKVVANASPEKLTKFYLEKLSDYVLSAYTREENQYHMLTSNRMLTINKHELSMEGLTSNFENPEKGREEFINNISIEGDKNIPFTRKDKITDDYVENIATGLEQQLLTDLRKAIADVEETFRHASGKRKYLLKLQLIEMRKDQYEIKKVFHPTTYNTKAVIKNMASLCLDENITFDTNKMPVSDGYISLFNPAHVSLLLCNYSKLKAEVHGKFQSDMYYMLLDLEDLIDKSVKANYPLYFDILVYKIDGLQNIDIQKKIEQDYGITHSIEYISSLWRNKIPKIIAEQAAKDYLEWYYTEKEVGHWKTCSKCGQVKLGHSLFFSKNSTSKDGWYSWCKECRNAKNKK